MSLAFKPLHTDITRLPASCNFRFPRIYWARYPDFNSTYNGPFHSCNVDRGIERPSNGPRKW